MNENNLLRDAFNPDVIRYISARIEGTYSSFDGESFASGVLDGFEELSFGDRARKITKGLAEFLPSNYQDALRILVASLGAEQTEEELSGFEGFYVMPFTMFVSTYGLDHPEISLTALYEMTKRFSAEGDIRPFIQKYPEKTMAFLHRLTRDSSPFARRLPSEGTRPRLPLAGRLPEFQRDPAPVIAILDKLCTDPNLMVRRSVANNINDISKDNPDVAVATLARWKVENPSNELDWLIRHGLRTLIKRGYPEALDLLGFITKGLEVLDWRISPTDIRLGESINISWQLRSTVEEPQQLALNYVIHFLKASGRNQPKVFRLPDKTLEPGASLKLSKTHKFLPFKNQRFYSGEHFIEIVINGETYGRSSCNLEV